MPYLIILGIIILIALWAVGTFNTAAVSAVLGDFVGRIDLIKYRYNKVHPKSWISKNFWRCSNLLSID